MGTVWEPIYAASYCKIRTPQRTNQNSSFFISDQLYIYFILQRIRDQLTKIIPHLDSCKSSPSLAEDYFFGGENKESQRWR